MKNSEDMVKRSVNRRSFLRNGVLAGGAAVAGAGLLSSGKTMLAQENDDARGSLDRGDVAILRFVAAAEIIEAGRSGIERRSATAQATGACIA